MKFFKRLLRRSYLRKRVRLSYYKTVYRFQSQLRLVYLTGYADDIASSATAETDGWIDDAEMCLDHAQECTYIMRSIKTILGERATRKPSLIDHALVTIFGWLI